MAMNPYLLRKPNQIRSGRRPTAVDLFSGAGGITLGLLNAGFDIRFCSDHDETCALTHHRNFAGIPFERISAEQLNGNDILRRTDLKVGQLDLLIGGPPCQGFSIIGQREIWDERNGLFKQFLRIASELQPKCVVIENVPGLATLAKGAVLRQVGSAFSEAGYTIDCAELLAAQYGVPQMRWRMFFIGWRKDLGKRGGFPPPTHGRAGIGDLYPNTTISAQDTLGFLKIRDAIGDLPRVEAGSVVTQYECSPQSLYQEAMRRSAPSLLSNHYAPRLSDQNLARIRSLKPGQDWRDLPRDLLPPSMQRALRKDHTRRFRRMTWDGVARSIITRFRDPKSGEYIHPQENRTISIREAARIQSFPDWFVFEGSYSAQYDQVGNAVPPFLARAVGIEIREMLRHRRPRHQPPVKSRYMIPADLFQLAAE
jgi:DNA (cytosine-5)-methyltransferase 1